MVSTTFFNRCSRVGTACRSKSAARRAGFVGVVGLALAVSGCASILGNDYEVETDAALGSGAGGSSGAAGSSNASGTSGTAGASGGTAGSGGAGGTSTTAGASGAGGSAASGGATGSGGNAGSGGAAGAGGQGGSAGAGLDASSTDATSETRPEGSAGGDAVADTSSADADATADAPRDASSCSPINGSCAGGNLTCNSGFSSCNGNSADGCECATSGCCGSSCQMKHVACMLNGNPSTPCTDGTGQYYYDCVPPGTFNSTQATEACIAVKGNLAGCASVACNGPPGNLVICNFTSGGNCACWQYAGSNAGRMFLNTTLPPLTDCYCPGNTDPTWN